MIWLMILLGNLINIGYKMSKDLLKEKNVTNVFSFIGKWFVVPANFFFVLLGVLCSVALVLSFDFTKLDDFMLDQLSFKAPELVALMIGFLGQWIFSLIVRAFKQKVKPD